MSNSSPRPRPHLALIALSSPVVAVALPLGSFMLASWSEPLLYGTLPITISW